MTKIVFYLLFQNLFLHLTKKEFMALKIMGIGEYVANGFMTSRQLVLYYINEGKELPNVVKVEFVAGRYLLHVK